MDSSESSYPTAAHLSVFRSIHQIGYNNSIKEGTIH